MAQFTIPDEGIKGFRTLLKLSKEDQEKLIHSISDAPLGCWYKKLSNFISEKTGIDFEDVEKIVDLLFSLTVNKRITTDNLDIFLNNLLSSLKKHEDEELKVDSELKDLLKRLISISTIQCTTKALELETSREKLLMNSLIITDIRPIFDDDNPEIIEAAVVTHNLKIRYRDSNGENNTIYIAVDEEDLSRLKKQIIRAEIKGKSITKKISNITIIKLKEEN